MEYSVFKDRFDAGRKLAANLLKLKHREAVVLALPRGGVPVAFEVARRLEAPLDVFLVRKLGVPIQPELAFGAIASGGVQILNNETIRDAGVAPAEVAGVLRTEHAELERRERLYRGGSEQIPIEGKTAILVDDGLATGASMLAAVAAARLQKPEKIVVAVPVCAPESCKNLRSHADEVICTLMPQPFFSVGMWYEDFSQTTDEEVRELLAKVGEVAVVSV